jgi:S1-C subfamily serine protease
VILLILSAKGTLLYAEETSLPDLIARIEPSVVGIDVHRSNSEVEGSGFIVEGGLVVTNCHVISQAESAEVIFANKEHGKVLGVRAFNSEKDLAVLEIDGPSGHPVVPVAEVLPRKGESVVAIGSPKGFEFTVSQGIVSAIRKGAEIKEILPEYDSSEEMTWVQTTAPISPGNSGGPLLNMAGQVVGVNSWIFAGKNAQNLNFAVAASELKDLLHGIKEKPVVALRDANISDVELTSAENEAQLAYNMFAKARLDLAIKQRGEQLRRAAEWLQSQLTDIRTTDSSISSARSDYTKALAALRSLNEFDPGVPLFLAGGQGAILGKAGGWRVVQVLGPDSMLVKRTESSDELFCVKDEPTDGKIDDGDFDFDDVWYSRGETYSYETVGGAMHTIYLIRRFPLRVSDALDAFRKSAGTLAVDAAIASVPEPNEPTGDALATLQKEREEYKEEYAHKQEEHEKEQQRLLLEQQRDADLRRKAEEEKEARIRAEHEQQEAADREQSARNKLELGKRVAKSNPDAGTRWFKEIIGEYPETKAASEAEDLLYGTDKDRFRTWTSGTHTAEAVLLGARDGFAILKKKNGDVVKVPTEKLSDADQAFIRDYFKSK